MELAYWSVIQLVYAAFFFDHSQNDFLMNYFSMEINHNIVHFKISLDIVQGLLNRSELTHVEEAEEE